MAGTTSGSLARIIDQSQFILIILNRNKPLKIGQVIIDRYFGDFQRALLLATVTHSSLVHSLFLILSKSFPIARIVWSWLVSSAEPTSRRSTDDGASHSSLVDQPHVADLDRGNFMLSAPFSHRGSYPVASDLLAVIIIIGNHLVVRMTQLDVIELAVPTAKAKTISNGSIQRPAKS